MAGPKTKYTKEYIIEKTIEYAEKNTLNEISVRKLSKFMKSSSQPIFSTFDNFESLIEEVKYRIKIMHTNYLSIFDGKYENEFLDKGMAYISFAKVHPNLFRVLYFEDYFSYNNIMDLFDEQDYKIINSISSQFSLSEKEAKQIFRNSWFLSHGIASLIQSSKVEVDDEEICKILIDGYNGFLTQIIDNRG